MKEVCVVFNSVTMTPVCGRRGGVPRLLPPYVEGVFLFVNSVHPSFGETEKRRMTISASSSHSQRAAPRIRFIFPSPAIRNLLLPLICLNVLVVYLHDMACPCDFAVTFV